MQITILEKRIAQKLMALALVTATVFGFGLSYILAAHQAESGEFVYGADLSGDAEVPAIESDTSGDLEVRVSEDMDEAGFDLHIEEGMSITAAHLHCGTVDENGPVIAFLFGNIPGGFDVDGTLAAFTLTDANIIADTVCPSPITDIESLATAMGAGEVYVNVHSVANPNGEIRGQLAPVPQDVPDNEDPDTNGDGFISVLEGVPFYGAIVSSLTTSGDTSPSSALALDRFPVASSHGRYFYTETITLPEGVTDPESLHVVIHGADLNNNGTYDGEKESSIAAGVPFEATVPVACGEIEMNGNNQNYKTKINELNSTGVSGQLSAQLRGDELRIRMKVDNVSPNIAHAQHFHMGGDNICPPNTVGVNQ